MLSPSTTTTCIPNEMNRIISKPVERERDETDSVLHVFMLSIKHHSIRHYTSQQGCRTPYPGRGPGKRAPTHVGAVCVVGVQSNTGQALQQKSSTCRIKCMYTANGWTGPRNEVVDSASSQSRMTPR